MKTKLLLAPALAACLAATALAQEPTGSDRALRDVVARLVQGERALTRADSLTTRSQRLRALEYATDALEDVRRLAARRTEASFAAAWRDAGLSLVRSLTSEAQIHYERGSLPQARDRALRALAVDPADARALNLIAMVDAAERQDVYDEDEVGAVAIQRIRERRAALGLPLRDRGMARRR